MDAKRQRIYIMGDYNQHEFLNAMAKSLEQILPEYYGQRMGFALVVFPFEASHGDYVSNCERKEMIEVLRETAKRIESNEIIPAPIGKA